MFRSLCYLLVIAALSSCTTPTPKTGCRDDSECGGGQECRQGACVPKGSVACSGDSDCNPGDPALNLRAPGACEDLKCVDGLCAYPAKAAGTTCPNTGGGNCTTSACDDKGACQMSVTSGCFVDGSCVKAGALHAGNSCESCDPSHPLQWTAATDDANVSCSEGVGDCQFGVCSGGKCATFAKDGGACDDKNGCTVGDICTNGTCKPGTVKDCQDTNPCTDDACDASTGNCTHKANTAVCDDGVACTQNDLCDNKVCVGAPNDATCTDSSVCTDDSCDKAKGCQHVQNTGACDDGNPCTSGDACAAGSCVSGAAKDCDDKNPCTVDSCASGVCDHSPLPEQSTCTDGAICKVGKCTAQHVCNVTGTAPGYCFIDQACVVAGALNPANSCQVCNEANQSVWSLAVDATPCASDNVACTDDVCAKGTCLHVANPIPCANKTSACTLGVCDVSNGCVAVPSDVTAACNLDGNVCTLEHCGAKNGICEATAGNLNCDDGVACTLDSCDPSAGCKHVAQSGTCDDGNVCTTDVCDGTLDCQHSPAPGACSLPGDVSCSHDTCGDGVCKAGAVANTCIIGGACVASGALTAENCQVCDPGKNVFAWSNSADGTACNDSKACHVNQCQSGACDHGLAGGWCEIDNACQLASAAKSDNVCLVCKPASATTAWSPANSGTACATDSIACTTDACDALGTCQHTATDSLCTPTPDTCSVPLCKPSDPGADAATGCVPVDDCPVGHHCDATAKACLTDAPIAIVTAGGDHPNPTNPALIRHVLDDKLGTTRTWVVFQTDTCATAANSQWSITKPAGLRAAIVDSMVGAPSSKATTALAPVPIVTLPTATGWADSATVCQGYPVVAHDPLAANLAWLSWLESAPGQTTACLTANGQGGLLRLGRLDGGGLPAGGMWSAVAGDQADLSAAPLCTAKDAFLPSFLTAGFGILPVAGTDVVAKGILSVRPNAALNAEAQAQMMRAGLPTANAPKSLAQITGPFSLPHAVVVDAGASAATAERFWAIALNEDTSGDPILRSLWAAPISASGSKGAPVEWSTGTKPSTGTGTGTGDLKDITAVCALDASVDAAGTVGVALVVRRAGKDAVLLVTRTAGSATGSVVTVKEQASADPGCAIGISAVRVAGRAAGDFVLEWLQSAGPTDVALGGIWLTSTASNTPVQLATLTAWDTDGSAAPLAWRGLGGLAVGPGGVVTTVIEGRTGTSRTLFLHSLKL